MHKFFSMATVVSEAKQAQQIAASEAAKLRVFYQFQYP